MAARGWTYWVNMNCRVCPPCPLYYRKAPSVHDCFHSFVYGLMRSPHTLSTCLACRLRPRACIVGFLQHVYVYVYTYLRIAYLHVYVYAYTKTMSMEGVCGYTYTLRTPGILGGVRVWGRGSGYLSLSDRWTDGADAQGL